MKILIQIIFNAVILYLITYLLSSNLGKGIDSGIVLGCIDCSYSSIEAWKTYLIGGIILGLLNATIRPLLKLLTLPISFFLHSTVSLFINASVLYLLGFIINDLLIIEGVAYNINGLVNFAFAVAIFTFLNTIYSILFSK